MPIFREMENKLLHNPEFVLFKHILNSYMYKRSHPMHKKMRSVLGGSTSLPNETNKHMIRRIVHP